MEKTPLGLTVLGPEDGLDADGYSFQAVNPIIIDHLLRLVVTLSGMLDPTDPPVLASGLTGGTIEADSDIEVTYTLIDANGGESAGAPVETITTIAPLEPPEDPPTLVLDNVGGALVAGQYEYAVTLTDGHGGETPVGPTALVIREPGAPTAEITIGGLTALVDSVPGAVGWRLYRAKNSGPLYYLAQDDGAVDEYLDTGLGADCSTVAPGEGENTTNAINTLTVTVPDQVTDAVSYRIYGGLGVIASPALLGEYPISELGDDKLYTELVFDEGQPPDSSRSYAAAGGGGGAGHTIRDEGTALTARPSLDFQGAGVTVTDDAGTNRTIVTIPGGGGGGGGGGGPRETVHLVAGGPLDSSGGPAHYEGSITVAPGWRLLQVIAVEGETRVRLYDRAAQRTADIDREPGTPPTGDHGVMFDGAVEEFGEAILNLAPPVHGYNLDSPVTAELYFTLTNTDFTLTTTNAVDLVLVQTESL